MAVKIRLMRVGKTKQPTYRVVVADSRSPRDGRIIEAIGHYQPRQEPSEVVIDTDRAVRKVVTSDLNMDVHADKALAALGA